MIAITLVLVVLVVVACEFVSWLRYPGGGTSFVTEAEVRRIEGAAGE